MMMTTETTMVTEIDRARSWWQTGLELRARAISAGFRLCEGIVPTDRDFIDWALADKRYEAAALHRLGHLQEALDAGLAGYPIPEPVDAERYGPIPEEGISKNFRDNRFEHGLSVARLGDYDWAATLGGMMGALGSKVQGQAIIRVRGLPLPWRGSDGEPLLCGAEEAK